MKKPPQKPHSPKKRTVTPEEKATWKHHTAQDEKLWPEGDHEEGSFEEEAFIFEAEPVKIHRKAAPAAEPPRKKTVRHKALEKSASHDIDRRTAERFRKGRMNLDATLDLHGHSRESAYIRLLAFIHESYQKGARCVLVITGRGLFQTNKPVAERGVLRSALGGWLNDPAIRPFILAFEQAQIQHGGEGAFYVLLKRKRA